MPFISIGHIGDSFRETSRTVPDQRVAPPIWIIASIGTALLLALFLAWDSLRDRPAQDKIVRIVTKEAKTAAEDQRASIPIEQPSPIEATQPQQQVKAEQIPVVDARRKSQPTTETLFQKFCFSPTIHLCNSLHARGVTARVTGDHLQFLRNVLQQHDSKAALLFLMQGKDFSHGTGYPQEAELAAAIQDIARREFRVLVEPQFPIPSGKEFQCLLLGDATLLISSCWTPHPSGVGWCHPWQPEYRDVFIFIYDDSSLTTNDVYRVHNAYKAHIARLNEQRDAGELSDGQYESQRRSLSQQQRDAYIELISPHERDPG